MNAYERMHAAFHHREADRVPRYASLTPAVIDAFREGTGCESPADYWHYDIAHVGFQRPAPLPDLMARFGHYHAHRDDEWVLDWGIHTPYPPEWGVATRPAHYYHLCAPGHPLQSATNVQEIADYPMPDYVTEWRHDHLEDAVAERHAAGYWVGSWIGWIYQTCWLLRSQAGMFTDFYENPDIARALFERIVELRIRQAVRLVESGVDSLSLSDDIGGQQSMLLSPKMWREWLKPYMARLIAAVRTVNPDIVFRYHSDGYYLPVIEDLIEIGVTSLRTIQPESMDPVEIKRRFGDRIVLEGTIGLQSELLYGTPAEVRDMVRRQCEALMPGGGWIACPGNAITPDIPLENVMVMFEALDAYGVYR